MAVRDVEAVARLISRLRFAPLSFFEGKAAPTAVADVTIFKKDGEWIVDVNDTYYPQLRFSNTYKNLLFGCRDQEAIQYMKGQAKNARVLAKAILKRKETLRKVSYSILGHQLQFFEYGVKWLNRLSMREIAEDISMNVSTVSRAVAGKFVGTPHGLFKSSIFFESGVGDYSATFIKTEMKKLLSDSHAKISDQKITDILGRRGIHVSRRTIAKYRQQENLPNSKIRKI
jgi:RNA polymerase sigma-54 factor